MLPAWAADLISHRVDECIANAQHPRDAAAVEVARRRRAWMVYGDLGGSLFVGVDGEVYTLNHNTMDDGPEADPSWRQLAWVAATEKAPELRAILPDRPSGTPDCPNCAGNGQIQLTEHIKLFCGKCSGLGWVRTFGPSE